MDRCPLCRAMLNGADTCRRCRAELGTAHREEREGAVMAGAAMYRLGMGDASGAQRLLRRALTLHSTPDVRALVGAATEKEGQGSALDPQGVSGPLDLMAGPARGQWTP